ncbi:hypothetical protein R3P38DRAFT_3378282 [Favolaschia claudopus]|uniref:Uncharacterized protein n=1 Tax=Favolaschia claudopus TaxID=2862362 RepID=A0AAV9ZA00_9AGAR
MPEQRQSTAFHQSKFDSRRFERFLKIEQSGLPIAMYIVEQPPQKNDSANDQGPVPGLVHTLSAHHTAQRRQHSFPPSLPIFLCYSTVNSARTPSSSTTCPPSFLDASLTTTSISAAPPFGFRSHATLRSPPFPTTDLVHAADEASFVPLTLRNRQVPLNRKHFLLSYPEYMRREDNELPLYLDWLALVYFPIYPCGSLNANCLIMIIAFERCVAGPQCVPFNMSNNFRRRAKISIPILPSMIHQCRSDSLHFTDFRVETVDLNHKQTFERGQLNIQYLCEKWTNDKRSKLVSQAPQISAQEHYRLVLGRSIRV